MKQPSSLILFVGIIGLIFVSCNIDNSSKSNLLTNLDNEYIPLNDSQYPYIGVPRIVIETENFTTIKDRTTEIPAQMQIYGETSPESEIFEITIRGRGNTSFTEMPKVGYKIELNKAQPILGLPKEKDWALIANYADKTHIKNFITYKLASWLGDEYAPRTKYAELYLNREYQGLYLLVETVKVDKNRVNISKENGYLIEIGPTQKEGKTYFSIDNKLFEICYPKNIDSSSYEVVTKHIQEWNDYLTKGEFNQVDSMSSWIDITDFSRYYWIQEFTKNLDAAFHRSIFFTWEPGNVIKMGPVWDFDMGYGNWVEPSWQGPDGWPIRSEGWAALMIKDKVLLQRIFDYWKSNRDFFTTVPDSILKYGKEIEPFTKNEFKRWPILESTESRYHKEAYQTYQEAIDSLNSWIFQRIQWMNENL